ncbi:hypothetical protein LCGC14_0384790 [marine sediment metagenome]|uniref:Uncharacterized protein n=1 Tax=marine sediment metagenome TaxID=412755 RepID=A0A0F9TJ97_9ZZZZ
MWKNNRPEGWEELRDKKIAEVLERHGLRATGSIVLAEAGADAILEALRKEGIRKDGTQRVWSTEKFRGKRGFVIFIEEVE